MKKAVVVALSLFFLPIYAPEKITPEELQAYIAHEIVRQNEERTERLIWKAAFTSSAVTGGIGMVGGIAIAWWMNRQ